MVVRRERRTASMGRLGSSLAGRMSILITSAAKRRLVMLAVALLLLLLLLLERRTPSSRTFHREMALNLLAMQAPTASRMPRSTTPRPASCGSCAYTVSVYELARFTFEG